jgi:heme/copper-type cytochrome/quinol oxidase subunit 3
VRSDDGHGDQHQIASAPAFYVTEERAPHHHPEGATMLGFWLYLMSDCLIFAVLFATFGVLGRRATRPAVRRRPFRPEPDGDQHRHPAGLLDHLSASPCWRWMRAARPACRAGSWSPLLLGLAFLASKSTSSTT